VFDDDLPHTSQIGFAGFCSPDVVVNSSSSILAT